MKYTHLLLITGSALLLSACGISVTDIHKISNEKLASGEYTKLGWKNPQASWQCRAVAKKSFNWATDKFKGMWKGSAYRVVKKQALAYANQQQIRTNYIGIRVPVQVQVGEFDATVLSHAHVTYYQCKNPPAISNKLL